MANLDREQLSRVVVALGSHDRATPGLAPGNYFDFLAPLILNDLAYFEIVSCGFHRVYSRLIRCSYLTVVL
jgi:hypothetical protein